MLSVITGKQRSGKTYYCVLLIIDYLRTCTRPIFTNLPLNPDVLCDYACGGRLRNPALYNSYMHRLFLFKTFRGKRKRPEYFLFKAHNPDYIQIHKNLLKAGNYLLIDQERIRDFWRVIKANSIVFLDELYQWFSSSDIFNSSTEVKVMRKELLTYTRQHGHFKDDMYLISHSQADLDINIRRGIQRLYVIANSKYTNISNNDFLKGLKWPVQFFIVKAYEYGEKEFSDKYTYFSKQKIFKCYDSFSAAETLGKGGVSCDSVNIDSGVDNKANIRNFFHQSSGFLIFVVITAFCLVAGVIYAKNHLLKTSASVGVSESKKSMIDSLEKSDFCKVVFISPVTVIFDDNFKLNIGDSIYGCKVEKFCRDYAVISRDGVFKRVSYSGLRLKEKTIENNRQKTAKIKGN